MFSVTASDDPDHPFTAPTATGCWSAILARVRKERSKLGLGKTGTAVSGPEFFGFAMPEIAACIEGLPGSENCRDYICRCLRMETNRKGKSRLKFRKQKTSTVEKEETEEKEKEKEHAPRRAAQLASKKWSAYNNNDSEDSADFSEEEEAPEGIDSESDDEVYRRRSRKRATSGNAGTEANAGNESQNQAGVKPEEMKKEEEMEDKMIKTEQFI